MPKNALTKTPKSQEKPRPPATVGELLAALSKLPPEMPLHRRGNAGDFPAGIGCALVELAESRDEAGYFADLRDPVWSKTKARFKRKFKALLVDA